MKERGMIFNGEMVRAILDGRKTQTRRVMKVQPKPSVTREGDYWFACNKMHSMVHVSDFIPGNYVIPDAHEYFSMCCPFGAVGDRIWVRETYQGPLFDYEQMEAYLEDSSKFEKAEFCNYAADGGPSPEYYDADDNFRHGWRPSIHMPRWASRILLEITNVRVERLQDISQADAIAEGAPPSHPSIDAVSRDYGFPDFSRSWFGQTWWSIYGEENWQANPWVWVIEFKRVEATA